MGTVEGNVIRLSAEEWETFRANAKAAMERLRPHVSASQQGKLEAWFRHIVAEEAARDEQAAQRSAARAVFNGAISHAASLGEADLVAALAAAERGYLTGLAARMGVDEEVDGE
jgi:hypothetical protein